jgi:hypothetical protein
MFTLRFTLRDSDGVYYAINSFETTNEVKSYLDREYRKYKSRCINMVDYADYLEELKLKNNGKSKKDEPVSTGGRQFK